MEERRAMRPIYRVQIVPGFRPLLDRRRTIGRMGMAGRRHRKGVTRRGTVAAGTGRHDRKSRRHERDQPRSEEHTSELQSLMRISSAVFCDKIKIEISICLTSRWISKRV